jgi:hypothetical protein
LFGKVKYKDHYTVQPATKDALAKFLDYTDWDEFTKDQPQIIHGPNQKWSQRFSGKYFRTGAILLMVAVVFMILLLLVKKSLKNKEVVFHAENITGLAPHTVSIHLNLSNLGNKDVYIDFDQNEEEDPSGREQLDKNITLINHCFESPGYFNVKLISKDKLLASAKVHVLSEGWSSYYFNNDNFILRKFVFGLENKVQETENNGMLYISPAELSRQGFNGNTVYYLEYLLYRDFNVSADSCTLQVRYKNSSDIGGISCYDAEFRIICENGLASVIFVQRGCYRWSEIIISEKYLNGKYNDLSFLKADLSSWNMLKILINHRNAFIINNADTVFKTPYERNLGQIMGIRLLTKGSGTFDFVRLYNSLGELCYDDEFSD